MRQRGTFSHVPGPCSCSLPSSIQLPESELSNLGKLYLQRGWLSTHNCADVASISITVLLMVFLFVVCGLHEGNWSSEILMEGIVDYVRLMDVTPLGIVVLLTASTGINVVCVYHIYCMTCGWRVLVRKSLDRALGVGWERASTRMTSVGSPRTPGSTKKGPMVRWNSPHSPAKSTMTRASFSLYSRRGCRGTLQHMRDVYRKTFYVDGAYFVRGELASEWFQYVHYSLDTFILVYGGGNPTYINSTLPSVRCYYVMWTQMWLAGRDVERGCGVTCTAASGCC